MKVAVLSVHTCPLAPLGGWETGGMNVYVRELSRELGARGVSVDIFTRRQAASVRDVVEYAPNVRVVHVDAGPRRHVDKYEVLDYLPEFACGVQRWRALTGTSYDLIHAHYWLSGRLATLFQDRWNAPMIAMFHTLAHLKNRVAETDTEREQAVRFEIERKTMGGAHRVVAATEVDRAHTERHYGAGLPLTVIPGGVDLHRFRPTGQAEARKRLGLPTGRKSHLLLFVGRIQRLKGLEVLIRAAAIMRQNDPACDLRVLCVGGLADPSGRMGPEQRELARLRRLAGRLSIADRVLFVGAVQQERLPLYYSAADVTVMPSSYESFGLVAAESLACGTPVVASRVGGLPTIVRDGDTGFLIPWRDPTLFAERLQAVVSDPHLRARLSLRARASVQRFGWAEIASRHHDLYAEVLADQRAAMGNTMSARVSS